MATVHYKSTDGVYTFVGVPNSTGLKIEALSKSQDNRYLSLVLFTLVDFEAKEKGGITVWNQTLENEFNTHFPA